jgi:hypothetical protein
MVMAADHAAEQGEQQEPAEARKHALRGQLDRFQAAFRAQVFVGGTLGLVVLLLYEVGSLPIFQADGGFPEIVPVVIYAFLAGFSEPFVLGAVQGLIGGRGTPPSPSRQSDGPAHPNQ